MACNRAANKYLSMTFVTDRLGAIDRPSTPYAREFGSFEVGNEYFNFLAFFVFAHNMILPSATVSRKFYLGVSVGALKRTAVTLVCITAFLATEFS